MNVPSVWKYFFLWISCLVFVAVAAPSFAQNRSLDWDQELPIFVSAEMTQNKGFSVLDFPTQPTPQQIVLCQLLKQELQPFIIDPSKRIYLENFLATELFQNISENKNYALTQQDSFLIVRNAKQAFVFPGKTVRSLDLPDLLYDSFVGQNRPISLRILPEIPPSLDAKHTALWVLVSVQNKDRKSYQGVPILSIQPNGKILVLNSMRSFQHSDVFYEMLSLFYKERLSLFFED